MLGRISEGISVFAVQVDTALWRMVLHVSMDLVGGEVKEAWSFTLDKVSAVGVSAFSEEWSTVINGGDSTEIASFKVLKNRGFQTCLCSSGWNRNRRLVGCLQKEEKEMFAGNKVLIENRKNNFLSRF